MGLVVCPICGKSFELEQARTPPFCSPQCKLVDLGRWLDEENRIPYFHSEEEPPESPPRQSSED